MVAGTQLVPTTGRRYCERVASRLPLVILPCPVALAPLPTSCGIRAASIPARTLVA